MVALGVIGLLVGIMLWISRGIASPISAAHQAMAMILLFVIPMSLGFAAAKAGALRERPWLAMIAVPLVFLAAVFVNMVVGASLGILQP
jgi:hypothetical protein